MPFDPELQARIDAVTNRSAKVLSDAEKLRAKLNKRAGIAGYADNTRAIEARLTEMGGEPEESEDGE
jgi:hypothetical protein